MPFMPRALPGVSVPHALSTPCPTPSDIPVLPVTSWGDQTPPEPCRIRVQTPGQGRLEPPRTGSSKCSLQQRLQSQEIPLLRRQLSPALPRECVWMKLEPAGLCRPGFPRGSCAVPPVLGWELSTGWSFSGVGLGSAHPAQTPLGSRHPTLLCPQGRGMSWGTPFSHPSVGCAHRAQPHERE